MFLQKSTDEANSKALFLLNNTSLTSSSNITKKVVDFNTTHSIFLRFDFYSYCVYIHFVANEHREKK